MIIFLSVFLVGIGCLIGGFSSGNPFLAGVGSGYLTLPLLMGAIIRRKTKRATARRVPAGSRISLRLAAECVRHEGPHETSELSYRAYSAVYRQGEFAILRMLGTGAYFLVPLGLLPGDAFEKLRDAIARAQC